MTSDKPAQKVWKMMTAFTDWCNRWTGDFESEISDDAVAMIDDCDISSFKKERARASRHRSAQAISRYDA